MLACMASGRDRVRAEWASLGAELYTNQRDDSATLPHGFMWPESETPSAFQGRGEELVHLDIWAASQAAIEQLEDAVVFLDDWSGPSHGNAQYPRWTVQSKTRIQEADGTWHTACLYLVRYGDRRKLLPV